jgi:hypothetical protein
MIIQTPLIFFLYSIKYLNKYNYPGLVSIILIISSIKALLLGLLQTIILRRLVHIEPTIIIILNIINIGQSRSVRVRRIAQLRLVIQIIMIPIKKTPIVIIIIRIARARIALRRAPARLVDQIIYIVILLRMLRINVALERELRVKLQIIAQNALELRLAVVMRHVHFKRCLGRVPALANGTPVRLRVVVSPNVRF